MLSQVSLIVHKNIFFFNLEQAYPYYIDAKTNQ